MRHAHERAVSVRGRRPNAGQRDFASRPDDTGHAPSTSIGSSQSPDTIRTAGDPISVQPIAHGTLALVYGRHVVLIDPARFVPGYPEPPREDLQELAKAYIAKFGAPPKPPASSDEEPNPDLLVSALPIRPEQIARFRGISPTIILITHTHTDHLDRAR